MAFVRFGRDLSRRVIAALSTSLLSFQFLIGRSGRPSSGIVGSIPYFIRPPLSCLETKALLLKPI